MLRPWVPLIALALLSALAYGLGTGFLAWIGGGLLAAALASQAVAWVRSRLETLRSRSRARAAKRRAALLDWSVIDNSLARGRARPDCERPETLGVCTGMECLVYSTCTFAIKKARPHGDSGH